MPEDEQELSEYTVTINGIEHTMLLSADDAARYGDDAKKAGATTKKATASNKSG
jgi:hypothetical protein